MNKKSNIRYQWFAPLAWMGLIFMLSHQSKADLASAQPSAFLSAGDVQWNRFWEIFFTVDWDTVAGKSAHIVVFGILAYLLWRAWPHYSFALWVTIFYGLSDEFHQMFIPGRTGRLFDLLFDALGAIIVIWWIKSGSSKDLLADIQPVNVKKEFDHP